MKKKPIFFLSSETRIIPVLIYFLFIDFCLFQSYILAFPVSPDEGGVGCGLLPLTALPGQAGMLTLPEALENLLHLQSMNSGILVAGYLGQVQSADTLEDAGSTFPRCLLQWFLNVLCIIMAWEALSMYAPALSRTY